MVFKKKELISSVKEDIEKASAIATTNKKAAEILKISAARYVSLCRRYKVPTVHEREKGKTPPWAKCAVRTDQPLS